MPYRKVTWNERERRISIYNWGCNFACRGCSYKLLQPQVGAPVPVEEIERTLERFRPALVTFLGGEPTTNPDFERLVRFAKCEIGAETWLGHTNGSKLPVPFLDGANVSFKAYSEDVHLAYTGRPAAPIRDNFRAAFEAGMKLKASAVYIPGMVEIDEIAGITGFLASLSRDIPFHLAAYVPVPGGEWRAPTEEEMAAALARARQDLNNVTCSHMTPEEMANWQQRSTRWASVQVL